MSELNRPSAPGPWRYQLEDAGDDYYTVRHADDDGGDLALAWVFGDGQEADAIADLPAWIEAHDMWKARAEKAEAALVLAEACLAEIRVIDVHDEIATILDKYGYWDDGE